MKAQIDLCPFGVTSIDVLQTKCFYDTKPNHNYDRSGLDKPLLKTHWCDYTRVTDIVILHMVCLKRYTDGVYLSKHPFQTSVLGVGWTNYGVCFLGGLAAPGAFLGVVVSLRFSCALLCSRLGFPWLALLVVVCPAPKFTLLRLYVTYMNG